MDLFRLVAKRKIPPFLAKFVGRHPEESEDLFELGKIAGRRQVFVAYGAFNLSILTLLLLSRI